jgi:2-methylcitrate dehydratase PrpD
MSVTERVAEFVESLRLEAVPPVVEERVRLCVLDTLGVAVAGSETSAARVTRRYARRAFSPGATTVLGEAWTLKGEGAGLANAVSASALDMDDGHRVALAARGEDGVVGHCAGHPGAVVVPAALATGEENHASGSRFLAAVLAGYEVGIRVAAARRLPIVLENLTGNWGAYAAAVAAAKVLGLGAREVVETLGLAASFGPNPQARTTFRTMPMVKESIGWSVVSGQASAALAADGFTGLELVLDDERAFSPALFADLGQRFVILDGYFKPHSACRMTHAAIDAACHLMARHGLRAGEVQDVVVRTSRKGSMLDNPRPRSLESAQYSVPICVAVAIHRGRVDPETLSEATLEDPGILATAARVRVEVDPEQAGNSALERGFPVSNRAEVVIRASGAEYAAAVDHPHGDAMDPLTPAEVEAKFHALAGRRWPDHVVSAIRTVVDALPQAASLAGLSRLLRVEPSKILA